MKYFSKKEIENFKNGSINYPLFISDDNGKIIEVNEIVLIGGMNGNNGVPTSIHINTHIKGERTKSHKYELKL